MIDVTETWLTGAKADDPDARKAIAVKIKAQMNRTDVMVLYFILIIIFEVLNLLLI